VFFESTGAPRRRHRASSRYIPSQQPHRAGTPRSRCSARAPPHAPRPTRTPPPRTAPSPAPTTPLPPPPQHPAPGMHGESEVRISAVDTGRVEAASKMEAKWFGEGLARIGDELYQITWQGPTGFRYSAADLRPLGSFKTPLRDGWGITSDGRLLVLSDGSAQLTWVDPKAGFSKVRAVTVTAGGRPVRWLNEVRRGEGEGEGGRGGLEGAKGRAGSRQQVAGRCGGSRLARRRGKGARRRGKGARGRAGLAAAGGLCGRGAAAAAAMPLPCRACSWPRSCPAPHNPAAAAPGQRAPGRPGPHPPAAAPRPAPQPHPQLEMIRGEIWANVWQTDCIARIDPRSGAVAGWVLMHGLAAAVRARNLPMNGKQMDVLNGGRAAGPVASRRRVVGAM
jgi:glutamine cyclotransferase